MCCIPLQKPESKWKGGRRSDGDLSSHTFSNKYGLCGKFQAGCLESPSVTLPWWMWSAWSLFREKRSPSVSLRCVTHERCYWADAACSSITTALCLGGEPGPARLIFLCLMAAAINEPVLAGWQLRFGSAHWAAVQRESEWDSKPVRGRES